MKKSIFSILLVAIIALVSTNATAQDFKGLDKSPMDQAAYPSSYKISDKLVKVTYSRPQLNGRPVSKLAPKGKVWRTGANEAAEITFYQDMQVGDSKVEKGTYTLFTIPGDDSWTIIISSDTNVWGAYSYNQNSDVVKVTSKVNKVEASLEAFSIVFSGEENEITMHMGWGNLRTQTTMTATSSNNSKKTMNKGTQKLMKPNN